MKISGAREVQRHGRCVAVSDEDGLSAPQHDDSCKHQDHAGWNFNRVACVVYFV